MSAAFTHVRDGRMLARRRVDELQPGDLVQHYSTWEKTWGDAMRREVVKNGYVPYDPGRRRLITWRDPLCPGEDWYETRERPDELMDVVLGDEAALLPPIDVLDVLAGVVAERDKLRAEVERMRPALELAHGAISYAVEDHHLHGPECLCDAALVTLRAARNSSREALNPIHSAQSSY